MCGGGERRTISNECDWKSALASASVSVSSGDDGTFEHPMPLAMMMIYFLHLLFVVCMYVYHRYICI